MGYLNNLLFGVESCLELGLNLSVTIQALKELWWILNLHKSLQILQLCLEYLGLVLDTSHIKVFLPLKKTTKTTAFDLPTASLQVVVIWKCMQVLGLMVV